MKVLPFIICRFSNLLVSTAQSVDIDVLRVDRMASTVPAKTVTFKLPTDGGSGSRAGTPDRVLLPHFMTAPGTGTQLTVKSPSPSVDTIVRAKTVHPRKLEQSFYKGHGLEEERPKSRPGSDLREVLMKQKMGSPVPTRDRSPLFERQKMSQSEAARVASKLRETTNSKSHDHTRSLKYEAARLREHLLKVEEEIKHLNRGKHTLEIAIQDIRRALSVNQQSLSTQQKKSRADTVSGYIHVYNSRLHVFSSCTPSTHPWCCKVFILSTMYNYIMYVYGSIASLYVYGSIACPTAILFFFAHWKFFFPTENLHASFFLAHWKKFVVVFFFNVPINKLAVETGNVAMLSTFYFILCHNALRQDFVHTRHPQASCRP